MVRKTLSSALFVAFCFFVGGCSNLQTVQMTTEIPCPFCETPVRWTAEPCSKCGMEALESLSFEARRSATDKALEQIASMPDNVPLVMYETVRATPSWANAGGLTKLDRATGKLYLVYRSSLCESEAMADQDALDKTRGGLWIQKYTTVSVVLRIRRPVVLYQTQCLVEVSSGSE